MRNHWIVALGMVIAFVSPARSADAEADALKAIREAKSLADKIDQHIAARWAEKGVKQAKTTGDGEFLRRVHLDLTGRIPRPSELLDFRDRYANLPREHWINKELLGSNEYVNHFAATWRQLIAPQDSNQFGPNFGASLQDWLRRKFRENAHYDQIARELIASPFEQNAATAAFFQANQLKPEMVAATTSRLFLGVKLECAQCHNHPFARWTRQQFWEFAAFFAGVEPRRIPPNGQVPAATENANVREIVIPETEKVVKARFLDGTAPQWKDGTSTRETLAEWLLRPENPFFARAAVNRLWAHFFGLGLVEPVDDLSDQNPASHPELLDLLAREFAAHNYDIKYMIRAITYSKTYQLSSVISDPSQVADPRLFARMNLKGLTGEQLYDSILIATDTPMKATPAMPNQFAPATPRADFAARFTAQTNRTEYETSILQALTMMNGSIITDATSLEKSNTLKKIAADPLDTGQRVEALYMAVLTRKPRPDERDRFVKYIDSGGPKNDPRAALSDVFWALLNSAEFLLNH